MADTHAANATSSRKYCIISPAKTFLASWRTPHGSTMPAIPKLSLSAVAMKYSKVRKLQPGKQDRSVMAQPLSRCATLTQPYSSCSSSCLLGANCRSLPSTAWGRQTPPGTQWLLPSQQGEYTDLNSGLYTTVTAEKQVAPRSCINYYFCFSNKLICYFCMFINRAV